MQTHNILSEIFFSMGSADCTQWWSWISAILQRKNMKYNEKATETNDEDVRLEISDYFMRLRHSKNFAFVFSSLFVFFFLKFPFGWLAIFIDIIF